MRFELSRAEADLLRDVLEAAARERQHQIHHADSRPFRQRLEAEAAIIEAIRFKLEREITVA